MVMITPKEKVRKAKANLMNPMIIMMMTMAMVEGY
jgi:hypothetical protein